MLIFDDIAITAEVILALDIAGLPTSDRALRRHAGKNGWPIVYDGSGKTLFLVDAIPEPFGPAIREALHRPHPRAPTPMVTPSASQEAPHPHLNDRIMEARLTILVEVFRRSAYVGEVEAIRGIVQDARTRNLPQYLAKAAEDAVIGGGRSTTEWSDEQGSIPPTMRSYHGKISFDENAELRWKAAKERGTLRMTEGEYSILSYTTLKKWIVSFNRHGARGLFPGAVAN